MKIVYMSFDKMVLFDFIVSQNIDVLALTET